jgi:hypothetical protein
MRRTGRSANARRGGLIRAWPGPIGMGLCATRATESARSATDELHRTPIVRNSLRCIELGFLSTFDASEAL